MMEHGPGKMEYKNGQWEITCMCGEWGCPEDWDYTETYYAMGSKEAIEKFKQDILPNG
jgi:hypothetical protein